MNNPIFFISTGRTGTKFFSNFFSDYAFDVASYHTSRFTRILNVLGNMYWKKILSRTTMKTLWKLFKYGEIESHRLRYLECNPYYYNMIDIVADFFPDAKFVFLIRFPRAFIISHIRWERQRWQSIIANRLVPFWQPTSYLDQVRGLRNNYYQRVEFYSKIWARKNKAILTAVLGNRNAIILKFEQVFHPSTGVDIMANLVKWLEVSLKKPVTTEMITTKINMTKGFNADLWDNTCNKIMHRYCQYLLKEFGYE